MILNSIRAEWFKVARRPSMWITVALLLAVSIGLEYVLVYVVATHPPRGAAAARLGNALTNARIDLYPASLIKKTLANMSGLYGIFALIIGVLVQGSEYAWGTVKTSHLQLPGRITIAFGSLVSLAVLGLLMAIGLFAIDGAAAYAVALFDNVSVSWPSATDLIKGVAAAWLILYFFELLGFTLATVLKGSAVAIGVGLAYVLVIENLVFTLLDNLGDTFTRIHELFPIANAGYLQQAFGAVRAAEAAGPPPVDANHAVTAIAVWVIGLAVIACGVLRVRDIT
ncbi:MAG TPA: hypothetical protein VFR33_12425 [Candidatus Dormibacteraeota bacterium]|nr:hypothetical protein [Candidatus Dormibacteraeota bacterium]